MLKYENLICVSQKGSFRGYWVKVLGYSFAGKFGNYFTIALYTNALAAYGHQTEKVTAER